MGDCTYCGQPAGFMRRAHSECKSRHDHGKARIVTLVAQVGSHDSDLKCLTADIKEISSSSYMNREAVRGSLVAGYEQAVERAFSDGLLSEEEEAALSELQAHFSLPQHELDRNGAFMRAAKGAIIRDVLNGIVPQRIQIEGHLPFNLQKSEQLVWVFQNVHYYEVKTKTKFVGGSRGVSVKIARGVYYRTGGFKGERVQTTDTVHADTGLLGVTTKHLYFQGSAKRFRINFNKIVSFEPYSDGIGIQRDAQTAKPQSFVTGDGWFAYNLIANVAQI